MIESLMHAHFEGRFLRVKCTYLSRAGLRGLSVVQLLKTGKRLGQQAGDLKSRQGRWQRHKDDELGSGEW